MELRVLLWSVEQQFFSIFLFFFSGKTFLIEILDWILISIKATNQTEINKISNRIEIEIQIQTDKQDEKNKTKHNGGVGLEHMVSRYYFFVFL